MRIVFLYLAINFSAMTLAANASEYAPIAIDVGHAHKAPGSTSAHGLPEFDFNKNLAEVIATTLQQAKHETMLIGADGSFTVLTKRTQVAAQHNAKMLLSIHHDSAQLKYMKKWLWQGRQQKYTDLMAGFSLFVSRKNPHLKQSLRCASSIGAEMRARGFHYTEHHAEKIAGENREWADKHNGVYYFDDLIVLKTAAQPAVLMEAGVISNPKEELQLKNKATQQEIANAVEAGLKECEI